MGGVLGTDQTWARRFHASCFTLLHDLAVWWKSRGGKTNLFGPPGPIPFAAARRRLGQMRGRCPRAGEALPTLDRQKFAAAEGVHKAGRIRSWMVEALKGLPCPKDSNFAMPLRILGPDT